MENEIVLATVGGVYADGLSLIFDGQTEATEKHYKCNTSVSFSAGDRVKILKDSGTYIVEYVVGNPGSGGGSSGPSSQLVNGDTRVILSKNGFFYPGTNEGVYLGANNFAWRSLWANGFVYLGLKSGNELKLGGSGAKIGFFGAAPVTKPTVSNTATVGTLISALKKIGLIG